MTFRDKVEALREKAMDAYKGEWKYDHCIDLVESEDSTIICEEFCDEDTAKFIAAASPDFIIELCSRALEAEKQVDLLESIIDLVLLAEGKGDWRTHWYGTGRAM